MTRLIHWTVLAAISLAGCGGDDDAGLRCGEGTIERDGACVFDDDGVQAGLAPQVAQVTITQLDVPGLNAPFYTLHPIDVAVQFAVEGEAFEADTLVGLQSPDGTVGCTIGTIRLRHDPPIEGATPDLSFTREFIVPPACQILEDRDDVEVFVAFDPWHTVNLDGRPPLERGPPPNDSVEFFDFAKLSEVPFADDCVGDLDGEGPDACRTALTLRANPGRDIEIQQLSFDNAVAILEIPIGEVPAQTAEERRAINDEAGIPLEEDDGELHPAVRVTLPTVPDLRVTTLFRVLGIDEDERIEDDQVDLEILIRPIDGAIGGETLEDDDYEWMPLHERHQVVGPDGEIVDEETERKQVRHIRGPETHGLAESVYIANDTYDTIVDGDWAGIQEFEVSVCFESEFREAVFEGESDPLNNNCAILPIILLRKYIADGSDGEAGALDDGAANVWRRDTSYINRWGDRDEAQVSSTSWMTSGFTRVNTTFGFGASPMPDPGGWYEVGTESQGCMFGKCLTLARATATFRDQTPDAGRADSIAIGGRILSWSFFPHVRFNWPDGTLSLQRVIDLANQTRRQAYSTSKSFEADLAGKSIETECGGGEASIKAFVEAGLNADQTSISKQAVQTANGCQGRPVADGLCFARVRGNGNYGTLQQRCREQFGATAFLAPLRSAQDLAAAREAAGDRWFVTGAYRGTGVASFNGVEHQDPYVDWSPGSPSAPPAGERTMAIFVNQQGATVTGPMFATSNGVCAIRDAGGASSGTRITATVTPYIAAGVKASLGVDFSVFEIVVEAALNLLDLNVPFVATLELMLSDSGSVVLSIGRSIRMTLATLSGAITFTMRWRTFWTSGEHVRNIASWDGFDLGSWWVLPYASTSTTL